MAHLFLSYAREDRECAEVLARALTNHGWSVWWDRLIDVGGRFSTVIEQELSQAKCVIVLWSRHSVKSDWVQSEASDAAQRGILVPVRIEDVRLPLEFRRLQTADLCDWRKGLESPEFKACLASVEKLVRKKTLPGYDPVPTPEPEPAPTPVHPEADDLWISQDGQRFRAPDPTTLRKWAKEGRVRADSHIYDPAVADWVPAREVPVLRGVYPAHAPTPTPAPLPQPVYQPAPQPRASRTRWPLIAAIIGGIGLILVIAALVLRPSPDPVLPDTAGTHPVTTETQSVVTTTGAPLATDTTATTTQPIAVSVSNGCHRPISVAVHYRNTFDQWVTIGWYGVPPDEIKPTVQAVGPTIYFFAQSIDGLAWYGVRGEHDDVRDVLIHPELPFQAVNNDLKMEGMVSQPFLGIQMDTSRSTFTYNFTCN